MMPFSITFRRLLLRRTKLSPENLNDLEELTAKMYQLMEEIRIFKSKLKPEELSEYKQKIANINKNIDELINNSYSAFQASNKLYMKRRLLYFGTGFLLPRYYFEILKIRLVFEFILKKMTIPVLRKISRKGRKHKFIV